MREIAQYLNVLTMTAGYIVIWGISLATPTTEIFPNHPLLYAPMIAMVDSEVFWGTAFIITGLSAIALVIKGKAKLGSLIMAMTSVFLSALFVLGDPSRPAWALFGMATAFNLIHWRFGNDRPVY